MSCAVEGECVCDSSNGSLTLLVTGRVGRLLGLVRMSLAHGMRQYCSHVAERGDFTYPEQLPHSCFPSAEREFHLSGQLLLTSCLR